MRNRNPNNSRRNKGSGPPKKSGGRPFSKRPKNSRTSESSRDNETQDEGKSRRRGNDFKRGKPERKEFKRRTESSDRGSGTSSFRKKGSGPQNSRRIDKRGQAPNKGKSKIGAKPRQMVASSWSAKGEAVYNTPDGKRTLIWSGIPFEKAIVQITHAGQHQNFGYVKSVLDPSPKRVEPKCKRYDRCGGCPFMHLSDEGQDEAKLQLFARTMADAEAERIDARQQVVELQQNPEPSVAEAPSFGNFEWPSSVIRVGTDSGYRMVSKLVAGRAKHGALRLGARNRNGDIVPIPDCVVTDPDLNTVGKRIAHLLDVLKIFPYTPSNRSGVRYAVLRKSRATKEILVTLVVTQRTGFIEELAERIYNLPFAIKGVLIHLNSEKGNAIFDRDDKGRIRTSTLVGRREITETVGGFQYTLGSGDFFQVNIGVAERIQQDVLEISTEYGDYPMIDLYCGVGLFTLPLAKRHGWAMGIELVDGAIKRAKQSAATQNIYAEFVSGDVFEQLDAVERKIHTTSPFIVVDPSRSGLADGVASSLDEMNPAAILYISCHPKSLARDLLDFIDMGWTIETVKLYDMFPNTVHMETLVLLKPPTGRVLQKRASIPKRHKLRRRLKSPVSTDISDSTPE